VPVAVQAAHEVAQGAPFQGFGHSHR
jgi:hypothetical protein